MKLILTKEAERKMNHYVQAVNTEIAGMGKIMRAGEDIILTDVAIYHQEVTGGTANIDSVELAKFAADLYAKGENPKDWSLWWHSHVDMQAYFSSIDTGTIDRSTEYEYLISLVVNKKQQREARLDLYRPFRMTEKLTCIVAGETDVIPADIILEVQEKVRVHQYKPVVYQESRKDKPIGFTNKGGAFVWDEKTGKAVPVENVPDVPPRAGYASKDAKGMPRSLESQVEETRTIIQSMEEELAEYCNYGQADSAEAISIMEDLADWYAYYAGLTGEGYASSLERTEGTKGLLRVGGIKANKKEQKKQGKLIKRIVDEIKRQEKGIKRLRQGDAPLLSSDTESLLDLYSQYAQLTNRAWSSKLAKEFNK